jgi:hypothetical protein
MESDVQPRLPVETFLNRCVVTGELELWQPAKLKIDDIQWFGSAVLRRRGESNAQHPENPYCLQYGYIEEFTCRWHNVNRKNSDFSLIHNEKHRSITCTFFVCVIGYLNF